MNKLFMVISTSVMEFHELISTDLNVGAQYLNKPLTRHFFNEILRYIH